LPIDMPRRLTNGGMSLPVVPARIFDITAPNDGCPAVRLVFSV
jgi:hypothetical protein